MGVGVVEGGAGFCCRGCKFLGGWVDGWEGGFTMKVRSSARGTSARFERGGVLCVIIGTGVVGGERPSQAESSESLGLERGEGEVVVVRRVGERVGSGAYLASKCCWKRACRWAVVDGEGGGVEES